MDGRSINFLNYDWDRGGLLSEFCQNPSFPIELMILGRFFSPSHTWDIDCSF